MNKREDLFKTSKEVKSSDLPHKHQSEVKIRYERRRMDLQKDINSLHQQTKSDNCNGFLPASTCLHCGMNNKFFSNHHFTNIQVKSKETSVIDKVFAKFDLMKDVPVSSQSMEQLKSLNFDNWDFDEADMLLLLQSMFLELSILEQFKIELTTLQKWLMKIYLCYNDIPFHNFKHCFCVTQMTYALIQLMDLQSKISSLDVFVLLFSAVCHDLDHPGFNNAFQVNSVSRLSIIYNDSSPLENHHCSTAFKILLEDHVNILKNLDHKDFLAFRKGVIRCILATDMAKHDSIMSEFAKIINDFEYTTSHHKNLLMMTIIKLADISNEMRNIKCSTRWMDCLFKEYFQQSDIEKEKGLPVTPFMDRSKVNKSESQVNFIKTFLLPSLKFMARLENRLEEVITIVEGNMIHYQENVSNPSE